MEHKLFSWKILLPSLYKPKSLFRKDGFSLHFVLFAEPCDFSALSSTLTDYLLVLELIDVLMSRS